MADIIIILLQVLLLLKLESFGDSDVEERGKSSYQRGREWGFKGYYQLGWNLEEINRRFEKLEEEEDFIYGALDAIDEINVRNERNDSETNKYFNPTRNRKRGQR